MQKVVPATPHAGPILGSIAVFALILSACAKPHNAYYWREPFRGHNRTGRTIEVHANFGNAELAGDPGPCPGCGFETRRVGGGIAIGYMASPQLAIYYFDVQWLRTTVVDTDRSQELLTLGWRLRRWISSRLWVQFGAGLANFQGRVSEDPPCDETAGYALYTSYGLGWEILSWSTGSLEFYVGFDASNVPVMGNHLAVPVPGLGYSMY